MLNSKNETLWHTYRPVSHLSQLAPVVGSVTEMGSQHRHFPKGRCFALIKSMAKLPIFITGNQNKADYLSRQLGIQIDHKKVDLDEIQSTDLHEIVEHKLQAGLHGVWCTRPR